MIAPRSALLLLAAATLLVSQVARQANSEYAGAELRRKAISEMEHAVRPRVERTEELVRSLSLSAGSTVADIGAGSGYLIPYLLAALGPAGQIYAVDILPEFLAAIRQKIASNRWKRVHAVAGTEKDPRLALGTLDVALLLDAYHHLDYPQAMLSALRMALKPGGRLLIVDYYRSRKHPGATEADLRSHIRLDRDGVAAEVRGQGFTLVRSFDHLPHEYVLEFRR